MKMDEFLQKQEKSHHCKTQSQILREKTYQVLFVLYVHVITKEFVQFIKQVVSFALRLIGFAMEFGVQNDTFLPAVTCSKTVNLFLEVCD